MKEHENGVLAVVLENGKTNSFVVFAQGLEHEQVLASSRSLDEAELYAFLKREFRESNLLVKKRIELARLVEEEKRRNLEADRYLRSFDA